MQFDLGNVIVEGIEGFHAAQRILPFSGKEGNGSGL
jgi:hypothetical protein